MRVDKMKGLKIMYVNEMAWCVMCYYFFLLSWLDNVFGNDLPDYDSEYDLSQDPENLHAPENVPSQAQNPQGTAYIICTSDIIEITMILPCRHANLYYLVKNVCYISN